MSLYNLSRPSRMRRHSFRKGITQSLLLFSPFFCVSGCGIDYRGIVKDVI